MVVRDMNAEAWLEQVAVLNELINDKLAERDDIIAMSARLNASMDDTPHGAGGVSDLVGDGAVKLVMLGHEIDQLIDQYVDLKRQINDALKKLPALEHIVLHKYYIRYMTIDQIAKKVGYCSRQISRIKKKALANLEVVIPCHTEM